MHRRGVVHADVKPENVSVSASGELKLIDFGQSTSNFSQINNFGTRCYRAPEAVLHGAWGPAVDVYAAGLVIWQLTARQQLFTACTDIELLLQQNALLGPLSDAPTLRAAADFEKITFSDDFALQSGLQTQFQGTVDSPFLAQLLLLMLKAEPQERPSAEQLLEMDYFQDQTVQADFLQRYLRYQDGPVVSGATVCGTE